VLETHYESLLVDSLVDTKSDTGFVVTASNVYSAIIHLRKYFSCGFHLLHESDKLLQYLHLLYQIIFNTGIIVTDSFCVGALPPVPKKMPGNVVPIRL